MTSNEAVTKILEIKVKYDDALQKIAEYNKLIDEAKVRQLTLNGQLKSGTITQEEYSKQMEASRAVINDYQSEVRVLRKEIQNNVTEQKNQEGSLVALRAELSNLTRQYDTMGKAEREGAKGKELQEHIVRVTTELKQAEEETKRFYRNVGNYDGAMKPLKQELRELTMQLAEMERQGLRGSDAYNEIAKQAGALADNIADARAEIQHYASDTRLLDNTVNIITTASQAWQTYQGAVQAFGIESQEAMEAMEKLQGIIALTNGLQALHATFTDNSTASYKLLHGILRLVGLEKQKEAVSTTAQTVAENANTAATNANTASETANITATQGVTAANNAETTSLVATTGAMTAATVAGKVLRAVLMTLGIGLVVAALGALVSLAGDVIDFFFGTSEEAKHAAEIQEALNEALDEGYKAYGKASAEIESYKSRLQNFNGTKEQEKSLVDELNDKYGKAMGYYETAEQWQEVLTRNGKAYCEMLLKEAQAQALLNKYTEAFVTLQETQRKAASEFGNWTTTKAGDEERKRKAVAQADADARYWMEEYQKKMQEAQDIKFDWNFTEHESPTAKGTGGSGGKTGNKQDDQAKAEADAQKRMLEEARKAQDALNKLIEDNVERRRKQINTGYDRQIEDIRKKLAEEQKLYDAQKDKNSTLAQAALATMSALNDQIRAAESLRQKELADLEHQELQRTIANKEAVISRQLEAVQKGSDEELRLKKQKLELELQQEIDSIDASTMTEQQKADAKIAIWEKYYQDLDTLEDQAQDDRMAKVRLVYENEINELLLKNDRTYEEQRHVLDLQAEQADEALRLLEERGQKEGQTEEEFQAERLEAQQTAAEKHKAIVDFENEVEQARLDAASQVTGSLIKLTNAIGQNNKGFAMMSKVLTLAQIAIDTGKALSAGIASASSLPYPANLAAIATTVATVIANVATAISTVNSAKFAHGGVAGVVDGKYDDDDDRLVVRVNKGEMILNDEQQQRLYTALTGNGGKLTENAQQQLFGMADGQVVPPATKQNDTKEATVGGTKPATGTGAMATVTDEQREVLERMVSSEVDVAITETAETMSLHVGDETVTLSDTQRAKVQSLFSDEMQSYQERVAEEVTETVSAASENVSNRMVLNDEQQQRLYTALTDTKTTDAISQTETSADITSKQSELLQRIMNENVEVAISDAAEAMSLRVGSETVVLTEEQRESVKNVFSEDLAEYQKAVMKDASDSVESTVETLSKSEMVLSDEQRQRLYSALDENLSATEQAISETRTASSNDRQLSEEQYRLLNKMMTSEVEVALTDESESMSLRVGDESVVLTDEQRKNVRSAFSEEIRYYEQQLANEVTSEMNVTAGTTPVAPFPAFPALTPSYSEIGQGISLPGVTGRSIADEDGLQEAFVDRLSLALEDMPAPVVSVEDINDGQRRVAVIENIDTM